MDTQIDLKNKFKIKKLVENYFSLTEKSQELFNHRLLYEPSTAPELEPILEKDQRAYFELPKETRALLDPGWKQFQEHFPAFVHDNEVTYEQFSNNSIEINGQKLRTRKAIVNYYLNNMKKIPLNMLDDILFYFEDVVMRRRGLTFQNVEFENNAFLPKFFGIDNYVDNSNNKYLFITCASKRIPDNADLLERNIFPFQREEIKIYKHEDDFYIQRGEEVTICTKKYNERLRSLIEEKIQTMLERIGTVKMPSNEVFAVLSRNFTDWFLASSGEDWGSCISLDSRHEEAFWTGMPGLIGDKSRALFFLTDGTFKEYKGIKTYKFFSRSWVTIARDKKSVKPRNRNTYFVVAPSYPIRNDNKSILKSILKDKLPNINVISHGEYHPNNIVGKYYGEAIYQKTGHRGIKILSKIYGDNNSPIIASSGEKAKRFPFDYYFTSFKQVGYGNPVIVNENLNKRTTSEGPGMFRTGIGLNGLIKMGSSVENTFFSDVEDYDYDEENEFFEDEFNDEEIA